jgi:hypothetical protein
MLVVFEHAKLLPNIGLEPSEFTPSLKLRDPTSAGMNKTRVDLTKRTSRLLSCTIDLARLEDGGG